MGFRGVAGLGGYWRDFVGTVPGFWQDFGSVLAQAGTGRILLIWCQDFGRALAVFWLRRVLTGFC